MSKFFIGRPIVAIVIAILMVVGGVVSILSLPTAQFPNIVPPEILVQGQLSRGRCEDPGAVGSYADRTAVNGVDNMNYMYSTSASNGAAQLTVDFDVKTNPDDDQILTQLRVSQAQSQLPSEVQLGGVTVQKSLSSPLMLLSVSSPNSTYDSTFLANYAYINLGDQLARVKGVSRVQVFGAGQYALRIWLKPDQMAKLGVTVTTDHEMPVGAKQRQPGRPD
jgi:HAE1 family hydrophobic/amphiphilic exporter-1